MIRMYALIHSHTRIHANDVIRNQALPNMCILCRRRNTLNAREMLVYCKTANFIMNADSVKCA